MDGNMINSGGSMAMSSPPPASSSKAPEFEPPQACVNRVIKSVLPDNVQVTKDARAAITRAAGIFIFYLTHCANDFCKENKRQTIYTSDIIQALRELDFGEFDAPLEEFLEQYRKEADSKKGSSKKSANDDVDPSAETLRAAEEDGGDVGGADDA